MTADVWWILAGVMSMTVDVSWIHVDVIRSVGADVNGFGSGEVSRPFSGGDLPKDVNQTKGRALMRRARWQHDFKGPREKARGPF
jgi:hypothetical protein